MLVAQLVGWVGLGLGLGSGLGLGLGLGFGLGFGLGPRLGEGQRREATSAHGTPAALEIAHEVAQLEGGEGPRGALWKAEADEAQRGGEEGGGKQRRREKAHLLGHDSAHRRAHDEAAAHLVGVRVRFRFRVRVGVGAGVRVTVRVMLAQGEG